MSRCLRIARPALSCVLLVVLGWLAMPISGGAQIASSTQKRTPLYVFDSLGQPIGQYMSGTGNTLIAMEFSGTWVAVPAAVDGFTSSASVVQMEFPGSNCSGTAYMGEASFLPQAATNGSYAVYGSLPLETVTVQSRGTFDLSTGTFGPCEPIPTTTSPYYRRARVADLRRFQPPFTVRQPW
jgi:hypothetical protein